MSKHRFQLPMTAGSGIDITSNVVKSTHPITVSTSEPSGGEDGDIWIQYTAPPVEVSTFAELKNVMLKSEETEIKVVNSILDVTETLTIEGIKTIDLNGFEIASLEGSGINFITLDGVDDILTIEDTSLSGLGTITSFDTIVSLRNGAILNVISGTLESTDTCIDAEYENCEVNMSGGKITGCSSSYGAPAVYLYDAKFTMTGGTISECSGTPSTSTDTVSGAVVIYNSGSEFVLEGGTIDNCTCTGNAGAVYVNGGGKFTMNSGTISNCKATGDNGGAIYGNDDSIVAINGGTITGCTSAYNGGGIYLCSNSTLTMSDGTITSCTAKLGAGIYLKDPCTMNMSGGNITSNTATSKGGGVYWFGSTFNKTGGTISDNSPDQTYPST